MTAKEFHRPLAVILLYGPHCGAIHAFGSGTVEEPEYIEFYDKLRLAFMRYQRNTIDGRYYFSGRMQSAPPKGNTPS